MLTTPTRSSRMFLLSGLLLAAVPLVPGRVAAAPLLCVAPGGAGGCFASIQAAVDAATTGTVIDVAAGTYVENVVITTPPVLTIRGAGAGLTIVDGADAGSVVSMQSRRLTLSGVTLRNGTAMRGGGIELASRARLELSDSEIVDNETTFRGGGIFAAVRSRLDLTNVVIDGNVGVGIYLDTDPDGLNGPKGRGSNLKMTGGALSNNTAGIFPALDARFGKSTVVLSGVAVHGNVATFDEIGVIGNGGRLTIRNSEIFDNVQAGGINASGSVTIVDSTIRDNVGDIGGLALGSVNPKVRTVLKLTRSTVSGNQATSIVFAGGLDLQNVTATIDTSTISSNSAHDAGGIKKRGTRDRLVVTNSTIVGNSATDQGGGILLTSPDLANPPVLRATILADNTAAFGPDCFGAVKSEYANLIEDTTDCSVTTTGTGLIAGADPLVGPLQPNGGPTETHALLPGSPAIGAVTRVSQCRRPDQRGVARTVPCDIGAYEAP